QIGALHCPDHGADAVARLYLPAQSRCHGHVAADLDQVDLETFLAKKSFLFRDIEIDRRDAAARNRKDDFLERLSPRRRGMHEQNRSEQKTAVEKNLSMCVTAAFTSTRRALA